MWFITTYFLAFHPTNIVSGVQCSYKFVFIERKKQLKTASHQHALFSSYNSLDVSIEFIANLLTAFKEAIFHQAW